MSQIKSAKSGQITLEMKKVLEEEEISADLLKERVARGQIVLLKNKGHLLKNIKAVGKGLRTKINANIGTSPTKVDINLEVEKLKVAIAAGADAVMDLSTGGNLDEIRRLILAHSSVPVGTVPIYQAAVEAKNKKGSILQMTEEDIFRTIEKQLKDGVDFITVHCGLVRETLKRLKERPRLGGIVSRGGGFLAEWMLFHRKENPLFEHYDELLKLASRYEVVLSLGDALRPGAIADASDPAQIQELIILGELAERAWEAGVGVLIEGPGHMPLHQIRANVLLEKKLCREAPFYVLGPLTTDIAPGYDHITTAIGGAVAALAGADFLCYVTPAEHLKLPNLKEVKEGVMAARIAAHSADLAKGIKSALAQDEQMSKKRRALDWEGQKQFALDPEKLEEIKKENLAEQPYCTMCGEFCTMQGRFEKYLERI